MEFLYKLYSNNYFGIGLFSVIMVLAFLFLIILFFGKKDEKMRIKEEKELIHKQQEQNKNNSIEINNDLSKEDIETPVIESIEPNKELVDSSETEEDNSKIEDIFETKDPTLELNTFVETPKEEMDSFVTSNLVLNDDLVSYDEPEETILKQDDNSKGSDIYNLDSLMNEDVDINMDDESIDDVLNKYDAIEEKIIDNQNIESFDISNSEEEVQAVNEFEENFFEKSNNNIKKSSTPFSSVYVSKEDVPIKEEVVSDKKTMDAPSRPTFDLPKRMDLPKKSANAINENIISSFGMNNNSSQDDQNR